MDEDPVNGSSGRGLGRGLSVRRKREYPCSGTPVQVPLCRYPCSGTPVQVPLFRYPGVGTPVQVPLYRYPCSGTPVQVPLVRYPCAGTPGPGFYVALHRTHGSMPALR